MNVLLILIPSATFARGLLAILRAASILAKDEKDNWLRLVEQNSQTSIEKWVAKWVREV
ncbi:MULTISPECIES: hypothetical protein [unclassified Psychrobacter]|uniref:hypothetical protein n=1 Tax=unclassified Psychrobacter TaxID=196806 RepID=UPI0012EC435B|nr:MULTISPECIES: hypothetical protein [unclassified Psychrobacter]